MNILFANYGDFTSNSMLHIAGFANRLSELGHSCIVAVPQNKQTVQFLEDVCHFQTAIYGDVLAIPNHFPNGKPADTLHAWTPREGVRKFVESYCSKHDTKVVVHLEDNESHIMESFYRSPAKELEKLEKPEGFPDWIDQLSHPIKWKSFCTLADATTAIISDLFEFAPKDKPTLELFPGTNLEIINNIEELALNKRAELGLKEDERIVSYTGGISSSNREDIRTLYLAVKFLNDAGYKTKLLKTGPSDPSFKDSFAFDISEISIDLGIIDKADIPVILAMADFLVQPGKPDAFNRYRLPSKLPEFLAAKKPVIATAANVVLRMKDATHCLHLQNGSPEEIAAKCIQLIKNPSLGSEIAQSGRAFALEHFSIEANTQKLLEFYTLVHNGKSANWRLRENSIQSAALSRLQELSALGTEYFTERERIINFLQSHNTAFERSKNASISNHKERTQALSLELSSLKSQLQTFQSDRHKEYLASEEAKKTLQQTIDSLELEKSKLEEEIAEIKEHFSWRLTAPLRNSQKRTDSSVLSEEQLPSENSDPSATKTQADKAEIVPSKPTPELPPAYRDYTDFCQKLQPLISEYIENFRTRNESEDSQPVISIVLPVYNVEEVWLSKAIDSIINQVYTHWELCIADDASTKPHIKPLLEQYSKIDDRIKVVFREQNGHISEASNSALKIATGQYIALLDHDDELPEHALARVVDAVREHPEANIIYSDEDKIDREGARSSPHFKSDWNPDLLLGQNFVSHLGVYRRSLVEKIGGFRRGFEGAQDWDLVLRASEHCKPSQIVHIPEVLYHWRIIEGSTATDINEKDYAHQAAGKVLKSHFKRKGLQVTLRPVERFYWKPDYPLPEVTPKVSIIIPTRDREDLLRKCIESITTKTKYQNYEIIIADNESASPKTLAYFEEIRSSRIQVLKVPGKFNFNALNNQAIEHSDADVVCLLNNDITVINENWLDELVSHASRLEIGVVGAKLYYPHNHVQHAGIVMGIGGVASEAFKRIHKSDDGYIHRACLVGNYSAVTAACMAFRRSVWKEVGGLNETEVPNAFGDVDFCLRIGQKGYRCLFTPFAELYHFESASRGDDIAPEKIEAFKVAVKHMESTWADVIKNDPYYNRNLTLQREDFTFTFPPRGYSTK
ncbi:glycosyltransferase [Puniceicoccaceae bacterium K14]|nr:glycosyltransferase [Puniceicoccaceae bacterium K14]